MSLDLLDANIRKAVRMYEGGKVSVLFNGEHSAQ